MDKPLVKKLRVSENPERSVTTSLDEAAEVRKLAVMRDEFIKHHQNLLETSMRNRAKLVEAHLWHGGDGRKRSLLQRDEGFGDNQKSVC